MVIVTELAFNSEITDKMTVMNVKFMVIKRKMKMTMHAKKKKKHFLLVIALSTYARALCLIRMEL